MGISVRSVASTLAVRSTRIEAISAIFQTSVVLRASLALVASRLTLPTDQASQVSMAARASATDFAVSVVLDKRPGKLASTADSTSVAALSEVASVLTPLLDVLTPSARPVVSVDSTRTLPQEVRDSNRSETNSSKLALMPPADLTDPSRDSAAARLSQVVPARLPSLVSKRDNSSVRSLPSQLDPSPSDPPLRLFPSEDVRVSPRRPPSPRDSTTAATTVPRASTTAATTAPRDSTTAATTDLNPSTTAASAPPASVAASAAREVSVATAATATESINTDKEQTGLSVISDIELFLSTLCSLVELLPQPCVLRAKGYKNLPKLRKKIISI